MGWRVCRCCGLETYVVGHRWKVSELECPKCRQTGTFRYSRRVLPGIEVAADGCVVEPKKVFAVLREVYSFTERFPNNLEVNLGMLLCESLRRFNSLAVRKRGSRYVYASLYIAHGSPHQIVVFLEWKLVAVDVEEAEFYELNDKGHKAFIFRGPSTKRMIPYRSQLYREYTSRIKDTVKHYTRIYQRIGHLVASGASPATHPWFTVLDHDEARQKAVDVIQPLITPRQASILKLIG